MSARAITRASVFFRIVSTWLPPRPPQPSSPTRTAELACMPRTSWGFRIVNAAAAPRNPRRPIVSSLITLPPSGNQFFKVSFRRENVLGLLRSFDLALDRQRVLIADLLQQGDQHREVHLALTDRNLAAQLFWIRRVEPVLGMNAHDMGPEQLDCVRRISFPIQDQVSHVEIDANIVQADVVDRSNQSDGRLLARLAAECLAIVFTVLRHGSDGV